MMPDSMYPRWGRNALRVLGVLSYMLVALGGLLGLTWPPQVEGAMPAALLMGSAAAISVTATVCAVAVALHRWRVEFMWVWWVGAALVGYVAVAGSQRPITPLVAIFMALVSGLSLTILSRGISLAIFAVQTSQTRRHRRI